MSTPLEENTAVINELLEMANKLPTPAMVESTANRVTTIDETSDDEHYPTAKAAYDTISKLSEKIENLGTGGSLGLTDTAKTLFVTILQNAVFTSDQTGNITALEAALAESGGGGSGSSTYSITNNLTNVTSDNTSIAVAKNSAYSATLTADDNHSITSMVVTMGGVDVTDSVYSNGVITIAEVTGDVVITAEASLNASANPFDYATWTEGTRLTAHNKEWTGHSGYATTDYVDMSNYSLVTIKSTKSANMLLVICWYDADYNGISDSGQVYINGNNTTYSDSFTSNKPDGVVYCRVSISGYQYLVDGYITFTVA